ncbi:MAG: c-type cytochrome [Gammaproteobacteria bacterium]
MGGRDPGPGDHRRLPGVMVLVAAGVVNILATLPVSAGDSADSASAKPESVSPAALFSTYCLLCHGPRGEGVPGLGVSLADSSFVQTQPEAVLVEFLKVGRLPNDEASISNRPMPGFAWMDTAQRSAIAAYLKAGLNGQAMN